MAKSKDPSGDPVRVYLSKIGRKGGQVKTVKGIGTLTPEERSERARQGAAARWKQAAAKETAAKKAVRKRTS